MNQAKQEILLCPRCREVLLWREPGFWKCPLCDGEWWEEEEDEGSQRAQIRACWLEDVKIPLIKKRRSSGRRKRRDKKLDKWWPGRVCYT